MNRLYPVFIVCVDLGVPRKTADFLPLSGIEIIAPSDVMIPDTEIRADQRGVPAFFPAARLDLRELGGVNVE
jgi:hypothetical protein